MNHSPFYRHDELKGFDFSPWGGIEGFLKASSNGATASNKSVALKRLVPDLSRAVDMTSTAIASLPFDITNANGEIIDEATKWTNKIGGMSDPKRMLYLLSSSLCGGAAYIIPQRTPRAIFDLQYIVPHSITPIITMNGLEYFERITEQGKSERYNPKELIYFWLPDSDVEIGAALNTPLSNAMTDAELILASTNTMKVYGERGWVPLTVLGAKGMPDSAERQKAEGFFDRLLRGGFDVLAKIINTDALSIVRLGAGFEELKGAYVEIKRESSESIAKSFGIPSAMFMSDNAFASEFDALQLQWYTTSRFRSIYQTIEGTLNEQLYKPYGVRWTFRLEELDIFQEDEAERSSSLSSLVSSIDKSPVIAKLGMDILGYDLTDEEEKMLDEIIAEKEKSIKEMDEQMKDEEQEEEQPVKKLVIIPSPDEVKDLALWHTKAVVWYKKGKSAVDWENKCLREDIAAPIRAKLRAAKNADDVTNAFALDSGNEMLFAPQALALQALADAINKAAEMTMKETPSPVFNMSMSPINLTTTMPEQGSVTVNVPPQPPPTVENKIDINVPQQPAPIIENKVDVNVPEGKIVVNVAAPNVTNEVTVKPADVIIPDMPTEATISTDKKGNKTLKVKK